MKDKKRAVLSERWIDQWRAARWGKQAIKEIKREERNRLATEYLIQNMKKKSVT